MTAELDELRKTHYTLIKEYVNILNRASKLPFFYFFERGLEREIRIFFIIIKTKSILRITFLVRPFVESHIKCKLNELRVSYVHLSQSLKIDEASTSEYRIWLMQAEEELTEFANTLSPWGDLRRLSSILVFLSPWIAGVLLVIFGGGSIFEVIIKIFKNINLLLYLLLLIAYPSLIIFPSFSYKRILFGGDIVEMEITEKDRTVTNIYEIEDRIFDLLEKEKIREIPIDIVSFILSYIIMTLIVIIVVFFYLDRIPVPSIIIALFGYMLIFTSYIIYLIFKKVSDIRGRKWR